MQVELVPYTTLSFTDDDMINFINFLVESFGADRIFINIYMEMNLSLNQFLKNYQQPTMPAEQKVEQAMHKRTSTRSIQSATEMRMSKRHKEKQSEYDTTTNVNGTPFFFSPPNNRKIVSENLTENPYDRTNSKQT